jgi:hypothetical protein
VERIDDRFDRALHVRLHHHREFDDTGGEVVEHRVEIGGGQRGALFRRDFLTILGNFAGTLLVLDHGEVVTG